jgi:hypothetical protein
MRTRSKAATVFWSLTALVGCDKVYFARIDIGAQPTTRGSVSPLTPAEHDQAVATFKAVAADLKLQCETTTYSIITDSYPAPPYQLTACREKDQYTRIQLADSPAHVAVEVHQLGGLSEPSFFRECRSRLSDRMRAAFPAQRVTIRYPYHWSGRDEPPQ